MIFTRFTVDISTPSLWRVTFDHPLPRVLTKVELDVGGLLQATDSEPVTTAGVIAVGNLEARIDGQVSQATAGRLTIGERAQLVELLALRGHVLGRIGDSEQAAALADQLVSQVPGDVRSILARARMRGVFHQFASALADLDTAAVLGGDHVDLDAERAAIYQALGRYDDALAIRQLAVERHGDFSALAGLAGIHGERGDAGQAERWFRAATRCYHGTSPFPLAMLEFQRGQLWMEHGELRRARAWCDAAVRRLPAYVPAQGHLAELDAALGDTAAAIARLRPLTLASDDPDYATQLARILGDAGRAEEAQTWLGKAEARYDELLARHQDAFADHAAEFWLTNGDPERALQLALHNLSLRQTPRARALVRRSSGHPPGTACCPPTRTPPGGTSPASRRPRRSGTGHLHCAPGGYERGPPDVTIAGRQPPNVDDHDAAAS